MSIAKEIISALTTNILPLVFYHANTHTHTYFPFTLLFLFLLPLLFLHGHDNIAKQSISTRHVIVVTFKAYTPKSSAKIATLTNLSIVSINRIYTEVIKRGFDPYRTIFIN